MPRLYEAGAAPVLTNAHSLSLLRDFKAKIPHVPTKSGLMVGPAETDEEILAVMRDMREHHIDMSPSPLPVPAAVKDHLPVLRYVHPDTFGMFEREAHAMGFSHRRGRWFVRANPPTSRRTAWFERRPRRLSG